MMKIASISPVRRFGVLVGACLIALSTSVVRAEDEKVPQLKTFKDWMVGCNNIRACTAIGVSQNPMDGYVLVRRAGEAEAQPQLILVVQGYDKLERPVMSLRIAGAAIPGLSKTDWPAGLDPSDTLGHSARLTLEGADAAAVLKAMRNAQALDLHVVSEGAQDLDVAISLAGSAAAFLYVDDWQKRSGTVTALADTGPAPASSIPAPPPIPRLQSVVMREVKDPPALPKGVKPPPPEDCQRGAVADVIQLGAHLQLWGVCEFANSHNFSRRYWMVGPQGVREAALSVPGHPDEGGSPSVLVNLMLSQDGRVLKSFTRGRGISDCGATTGWVWTGTAFQLAYFYEMNACRGVPPDDWPSLYVTRWE